ncbi:MAG TPA: phytanoyl-CoA dioxygenase family protein [Stellaceae bacterium]|nr:phytanoyl-CoA dioxygenase family protein [Stellaceae bacterium]
MTLAGDWTIDWRPDEAMLAARLAALRPAAIDVPEEIVRRYREDGVVLIRGLYAEWVERLQAGLERILQNSAAYAFPSEAIGGGEAGRFFDAYCNWHVVPEFMAFCLTSSAASLAARLMGSATAQLFHEHVFSKEPGTAKATPWHHDMPYYSVAGTQTASVYVPLDETPEDIAVRFVAGSHRWGRLYHPRGFADGEAVNLDDPEFAPLPDLSEARILGWALQPGDALVFDFKALHGTTANPIRNRRRAFSARFLGDDAHFHRRRGETSPPLEDRAFVEGERLPERWFPVVWRER